MANITQNVVFTEDSNLMAVENSAVLEIGMLILSEFLPENTIITNIRADNIIEYSRFAINKAVLDIAVPVTFEKTSFSEKIENFLYEKLKYTITDWTVELTNVSPDLYNLLHPNGAVLIYPFGMNYNDAGSGLVPTNLQERFLNYQITLMSRNLRTAIGVQRKIELIQETLRKFIPYGCRSPFSLYDVQNNGFDDESGAWEFTMQFKILSLF